MEAPVRAVPWDEQSILPCGRKEELQWGDRLCLLNWLLCCCKNDCERDYMSVKLTCSTVLCEEQRRGTVADGRGISVFTGSSMLTTGTKVVNESDSDSEFPNYGDHGNETHFFFSPILVAGVVIGIVLFLSCITIIVGGLRKERRLRRQRPRTDVFYAPDGFSYGGSFGELRAACIEEYPPNLELGASVDTRQRVVNVIYSDSPPRYEECVGPGARQMYMPTDNPPPYSVTDPCRRNETSINIGLEAACGSACTANCPVRLQNLQRPTSSISLSPLALGATSRYETVVRQQNTPVSLVPIEVLKNSSPTYQAILNQVI
ncbi:protein BEAN1 isoform X1 [Pezoporus wallicus]|uniref:protein BEAN1 isoform X1 n=1 Tax=Pezoporus wallicus TaxID=35540 RepID=UPI00254A7F47|nr:protein BEAN1 isoform X1 [Pezoporus wallicus]